MAQDGPLGSGTPHAPITTVALETVSVCLDAGTFGKKSSSFLLYTSSDARSYDRSVLAPIVAMPFVPSSFLLPSFPTFLMSLPPM